VNTVVFGLLVALKYDAKHTTALLFPRKNWMMQSLSMMTVLIHHTMVVSEPGGLLMRTKPSLVDLLLDGIPFIIIFPDSSKCHDIVSVRITR
jgi:hypothetical protein